jgi:hypothetical protein
MNEAMSARVAQQRQEAADGGLTEAQRAQLRRGRVVDVTPPPPTLAARLAAAAPTAGVLPLPMMPNWSENPAFRRMGRPRSIVKDVTPEQRRGGTPAGMAEFRAELRAVMVHVGMAHPEPPPTPRPPSPPRELTYEEKLRRQIDEIGKRSFHRIGERYEPQQVGYGVTK